MCHLCGSLCILVYKMLTLTIFTQKRWEVWLKCLYRFKGICHNVFRGTEKDFCDITYFPHKCATFVVPFVFWYTKMLTLTIFTQKRWGVWLKCLYRFKGYIMCFVEQKTFSVILRIFLTNVSPLWFPLYFGIQKCWRWQFCTQKRWEVWLKCLYRFKGYYNVLRGTENIFCDITYFPHKCATFVVSFVFWYKKCWRWQFLLKNVEEYG